MRILVPVDGSDCSFRALDFATEFAERFEATLHVIHITEQVGEQTNDLISRVREVLDEAGITANPEIVTDVRMDSPRYANQVGKDILAIAEEDDYDHVVMGHHGTGRIGRAILGSAAETVLRAADRPATIIP